MSGPRGECCRDCYFAVSMSTLIEDDHVKDWHFCQRWPPDIDTNEDGDYHPMQRPVAGGIWCGEFKRKDMT